MSKIDRGCFICGGTDFGKRTDYLHCLNCGHEALVSTQEQGFIINDDLCEKEVRRMMSLDRLKALTLAFFDSGIVRKQLLEIRSFYHNACSLFTCHGHRNYARVICIIRCIKLNTQRVITSCF